MAARIAACESGERRHGRAVVGTHDWTARNRYSSASGAFQFIDSTWRSVTHRHDRAYQAPPAVQTAAFYRLWDNGRGAFHWKASRGCWA